MEVGARNEPRLNERPELEVHRIHVRRKSGIVTKSSVSILAPKCPARRFINGSSACGGIPSKLAQNKHRVKAGMNVPIGRCQLPSSIGPPVAQNATQTCTGLSSRLANQSIEMHKMK